MFRPMLRTLTVALAALALATTAGTAMAGDGDAAGGEGGGRRPGVDREGGPNKRDVAKKVADRAEAKTGERPDTKAEVKKAGKAMGLGEVIREAKQNAKDNPNE